MFSEEAKAGGSFSQEFSFHHPRGVAYQNDDTFFASGLNHGGNIHSVKIADSASATLREWVAKSFGDKNPSESECMPGNCYKRIWRPVCAGGFHRGVDEERICESFVSLRILLNKLDMLFETIEPTAANLYAFGHKIREVLLPCLHGSGIIMVSGDERETNILKAVNLQRMIM